MAPSPRPRRRLVVLALVVLLLAPLSYGGIALVSAHLLTRASNQTPTLDPHQVGAEARRWITTTADGLTLRGWYFPTPEHQALVVCVHGMTGDWSTLAGVGHDLHRLGYDVLLFDLRGHGESDASRLFMGRRERDDLRAVLAWARQAGFAPERIGWLGVSMGAATLLMEGAQNPAIRLAVLDSPFGNLPELLDAQLSQHSGLPRLFNPGIIWAARWAFGVRTDDLIPLRDAARWRDRPLLILHGELDSVVPVRQGRLLARAAGPRCRFIALPGVDHVAAYSADPVRYIATVDRFFRDHLAPSGLLSTRVTLRRP